MAENIMDESKMQAIQGRQLNCDHLGEYEAAGQKDFEDKAKGVIVLITTVMCKKCGLLFFDTQETNIKIRVTEVKIPLVNNEESNTN